MQNSLVGCIERHRQEALKELVIELTEFSYDGLTLLAHDLAEGQVIRGSWAGCVLSYKRGRPGSSRRDRCGRARNPFTILWDDGVLTDEEVLATVIREKARRAATLDPTPMPRTAPASEH